ncbi:MAG TPA: hypothetical protein VFZ91_01625 [Allosphingosinicella sp.]
MAKKVSLPGLRNDGGQPNQDRPARTVDEIRRDPESKGKPEPVGLPEPKGDPVGSAEVVRKRCCCNIQIYMDYLEVEETTDAGDIPGISDLFGLAADRVFILVTDCKGKVVKYPTGAALITLDDGERSQGITLATVEPNPENCRVSCGIQIVAQKASRFNDILDLISDVAVRLAEAVAKLTKDTAAANLLPPALGMTAPQVKAALALVQADKALVDDLNGKLTDLFKLLAGTKEGLMMDFEVLVQGNTDCGDDDWRDVLKKPDGWKADGPNRASLIVRSELLGGKWNMKLTAIRDCPRR